MFGREIKLICRFRKSIITDLRERLRKKTGVVLVSVLETNCKIILVVCLLQHLNDGVFFFPQTALREEFISEALSFSTVNVLSRICRSNSMDWRHQWSMKRMNLAHLYLNTAWFILESNAIKTPVGLNILFPWRKYRPKMFWIVRSTV